MLVIGVPVALKLIPGYVFVPFLLASSLGRRFISTAATAVVDADGLSLNDELVVPRAEIGDVWLDDDAREPRVVVSRGTRLLVLWFANRGQAERCAEALGEPRVYVAGHLPRPIDLLASLRFISIALPFILIKNPLALVVLLVAAPGVVAFLRGRQITVKSTDLSIATWRGTTVVAFREIVTVDEEAAALSLRDGRTIGLPRGAIRDVLLAAPPWTGRAHARILQRIASRTKSE